MILSVSRRTDIVAFYLDWFFNRLKEGYVLVRNPMNYRQVSSIKLAAPDIDCIVFWTKDPTNILDKISMLNDYVYYFHVTITGYDRKIEPCVPQKEHIIQSFQKLSDMIGSERVIWRYDPIMLTRDIGINFHCSKFEYIASQLAGFTRRCTISFVDMYRKTQRNTRALHIQEISDDQKIELAAVISDIAGRYGIKVETCCEEIDLSKWGITHGKCIDDDLISSISGHRINAKKDKNQRTACGCVESVDIGAYNTCRHGCLYCYANYSPKAVSSNVKKHDPGSPMLIGNIEHEDVVTQRKAQRLMDSQMNFFD